MLNIIKKYTPNFTVGNNRQILGVCLHRNTGTKESTFSWFASPDSEVSSHYLIGKDRKIYQFVDEKDIAWTEGVVTRPSWKLLPVGTNPNAVLIAIEHENITDADWTSEMKQDSANLCKDILTRHNLPIDRQHILGHYQIDLDNRPNCPANDKSIIDEIVNLANPPIAKDRQATPQELSLYLKIIELLKQAIAIFKGR